MSSIRRIPLLASLVACLAVTVMLALGCWQLDRASGKQQRLQHIADSKQYAAWPLRDLLNSDQDIRDLPLVASGRIQAEHYFLLDNRIVDGRVGYQVLAPMETDYGMLLVNFGWVEGTGRRDLLPMLELPAGNVTLEGVVSVPVLNSFIEETATTADSWPIVVQQVDLARLSALASVPLLPFVMLLDPLPDSGFVRNWTPVVMPPEKHIGYAIQWFALALAAVLIYLLALKKIYFSRERQDD